MRAIAFVLSIGLSSSAYAGECQSISGASDQLAHVDAADRLAFIQTELRHSARKARMWTWGWFMALGALTTGQLALLPAYTHERKPDLYVGAGTSFVGSMSVVVLPMKVMSDQRWLDKRVRDAQPGTDTCALLADAERLLVRDAKDQDPRNLWLLHAGNVLLNIGAGLVLGLAFDRWKTAFINGAAGIAIGEVLVLTRPTDAVGALQRYRVGVLGRSAAPPKVAWGASLMLDHDRYGMNVALSF